MNVAILLAGGTGSRMGDTKKPKQFLNLCGKPVIAHSLETFENCKSIDKIILVCADEFKKELLQIAKSYNIKKITGIANAGKTRSESSWNALCFLMEILYEKQKDKCIVLIHDSARPLVSKKIIEENIECAKNNFACETVIHSVDTIIQSFDRKTAYKTLNRNELFLVQTPQSFTFNLIYSAYEKFFALSENEKPNLTDDASVVQFFNNTKVHFVYGDKKNTKLTTKEDFAVLEILSRLD